VLGRIAAPCVTFVWWVSAARRTGARRVCRSSGRVGADRLQLRVDAGVLSVRRLMSAGPKPEPNKGDRCRAATVAGGDVMPVLDLAPAKAPLTCVVCSAAADVGMRPGHDRAESALSGSLRTGPVGPAGRSIDVGYEAGLTAASAVVVALPSAHAAYQRRLAARQRQTMPSDKSAMSQQLADACLRIRTCIGSTSRPHSVRWRRSRPCQARL